MPPRLVLLSPFRMPAHHALMLGEEDTKAWFFAYRSLWHPELLAAAQSLPSIDEPNNHAQPVADTLYALPATPPPYLPENWDELVRGVGAAAFRTGATWEETNANLKAAWQNLTGASLQLDEHRAEPFFAVGFGYAVLDTLFEAMEHERVLDVDGFTADVLSAAQGDDVTNKLRAAAEKLASARDVLYPVAIHLIDIATFGRGDLPLQQRGELPLDVIVTAESLRHAAPDQIQQLKTGLLNGNIELCGGIDHERPDTVLPLESQLWNLRRGQQQISERLGQSATVYARSMASFHPYVPNWITQADLHKVLYTALDSGSVPSHAAAAIRWPSPDGRQVNAVTRAPYPADDPQTFFHLAHYLHQSIMQDSAAVLLLRHGQNSAGPWYGDWLTLSRMAPVLGTWTTLGQFLEDAAIGEYAAAANADDFAPEELEAAVTAGTADPISRVARHARQRRRLDAAWTYQALLQSLGTRIERPQLVEMQSVEDEVEHASGDVSDSLQGMESACEQRLANRLLSRAGENQPGWLLLNPCSFTRRIGLEWPNIDITPPIGGPVKAVQRDSQLLRLVVEVPGLGYAWIPKTSVAPPASKLTLATDYMVRNEFFEAEIDPNTGGLRAFRDTKNRISRLGQQLVWQPGSTMKADDVKITSCGAALGEITATGRLVDAHDEVLATFRQRFRAWLGRPLLEVAIDIHPTKPVAGFPWHAYFGSRFAWAEERANLVRGIFGRAAVTTHHRPGSPDFIECRSGRASTLLVTGGLAFAQRHGARMLDVLLQVAGETATSFEIYLGCDRPQPAFAAQGVISPIAVVPVDRGPPRAGPEGWLAHLDAGHVVMTSLRPQPDSASVLARLFEVNGTGGSINFRWVRNPINAAVVDGDGSLMMDAYIDGDAVSCDVMAHDLVNLRIDWAN
jgi:hypothetical protein